MSKSRPLVVRSLIAAAVAGLAVVTPFEVLPFLLVAGAVLAVRWARGGVADWAVPGAVAAAIVLAAHFAPVKTVDQRLARRMTVPKVVMTVAELRNPREHGLDRPSTSHLLWAGGDDPDAELEGLTVRFPSSELSEGEFIRAIEEQTPFRHHYFGGCGNSTSILYGSSPYYLGFRLPRP